MIFAFLLVACSYVTLPSDSADSADSAGSPTPTTEPVTDEDCFPTTGDNCDCNPKCMTQAQYDEANADGHCDLGCLFEDGYPWTCRAEDGACVVVED